MCYNMGYELPMILIVGILHTALLKKVLDTFLPAGDKDRLMWKIVFAGYYLLTTAAYGVFHVSFPYEICNLAGILGVACFYRSAWEKKIWISMVWFCLDTGSGTAVSLACSEMVGMQQAAVSALLLLICVAVVCHIPDPRESREKALDKKADVFAVCNSYVERDGILGAYVWKHWQIDSGMCVCCGFGA